MILSYINNFNGPKKVTKTHLVAIPRDNTNKQTPTNKRFLETNVITKE